MKQKRIAILGCGNLGMAILNGLLSSETVAPNQITITKRNTSTLPKTIHNDVTITTNNGEAVSNSDILIVALKPYTILPVLKEVQPLIQDGKHSVISLATGISLQQLQDVIQKEIPIFRAMPNTAADVSNSLTCICSNQENKEANQEVISIFDSIGKTIAIPEELMEAATVLGACGIAYALRFIRGMIQGGIQIGFDSLTATTIATNTVKGAAELLIQRKNHPEFEIDKVTTPRGCTITGLNEMEHNGFSSALIKGINASYQDILSD